MSKLTRVLFPAPVLPADGSKELIDVGIPRPRDPEAVRGSPRYATLRRYIWNELKPEVAGSGEAP